MQPKIGKNIKLSLNQAGKYKAIISFLRTCMYVMIFTKNSFNFSNGFPQFQLFHNYLAVKTKIVWIWYWKLSEEYLIRKQRIIIWAVCCEAVE